MDLLQLTWIIEVFEVIYRLKPVEHHEVSFPDEGTSESLGICRIGSAMLDLEGIHAFGGVLYVALV